MSKHPDDKQFQINPDLPYYKSPANPAFGLCESTRTEALKYAQVHGIKAASKIYNVSTQSLYSWRKSYTADDAKAQQITEQDKLDIYNAAVIQAVLELAKDTRNRLVKDLDQVQPEPPHDEILMDYSTKQIAGMCAVVGIFTAAVWIGGWFFGVS